MADDGVGSRIPFLCRCQVGSKQKVPETTWGLLHLLRNYDCKVNISAHGKYLVRRNCFFLNIKRKIRTFSAITQGYYQFYRES